MRRRYYSTGKMRLQRSSADLLAMEQPISCYGRQRLAKRTGLGWLLAAFQFRSPHHLPRRFAVAPDIATTARGCALGDVFRDQAHARYIRVGMPNSLRRIPSQIEQLVEGPPQ